MFLTGIRKFIANSYRSACIRLKRANFRATGGQHYRKFWGSADLLSCLLMPYNLRHPHHGHSLCIHLALHLEGGSLVLLCTYN
jgi:hypothetical protein